MFYLNVEKLKLTVESFGATRKLNIFLNFCKFIGNRFWEAHEHDDSIPTLNHKTAEENENLAKERELEQYLEAQAS